MTTATTEVVKEDLATPADPFDMGSGRIRVDASVNPGLTISESAQGYAELTPDPRTTLDINVPSLNAPVMPGRITTTRRVTNVSGGTAVYTVSTQAPDGTSISVSPARFTVAAGATRTLTVTIEADPGVQGQQFGRIDLAAAGRAPLHLPVAFVPRQGGVALTSDCAADDIEVGATTTCSVTATNEGFADTTIDLQVSGTDALGLTGPGQTNGVAAASVPLAGHEPGVPSLAEYGPLGDGYLPLDGFGVEPEALGDEDAIDFETAPFLYNGVVHDSFSVVSNGYLVVGGPATSPDIQCCPPQQFPTWPHPTTCWPRSGPTSPVRAPTCRLPRACSWASWPTTTRASPGPWWSSGSTPTAPTT